VAYKARPDMAAAAPAPQHDRQPEKQSSQKIDQAKGVARIEDANRQIKKRVGHGRNWRECGFAFANRNG